MYCLNMLKKDISLKEYTNYKIGGPARYFLETDNLEEIQEVILKHKDKKLFILGGGTNVLIDDKGFDGLVIHPVIDSIEILEDGKVRIGSGTSIGKINIFCAYNNLSGFEWSGGLPGTIGGAVYGNAGAFGGETKDTVVSIESLNLNDFSRNERSKDECKFDYRTSIFKSKLARKEMILFVTLQLMMGKKNEIQADLKEKILYRKERQPLEFPSAGSTFKNVPIRQLSDKLKNRFEDKIKNDPYPILPAAVLLADANLFGLTYGGAKVSEKHPNFLINFNKASSHDVEILIKEVQKIIKEKYNINLETELVFV